MLVEDNNTILNRRQVVEKLGSVIEKMVSMGSWNWNGVLARNELP